MAGRPATASPGRLRALAGVHRHPGRVLPGGLPACPRCPCRAGGTATRLNRSAREFCVNAFAVDLDKVRAAIGSKDKKLLGLLQKEAASDLEQIEEMIAGHLEDDEDEDGNLWLVTAGGSREQLISPVLQ